MRLSADGGWSPLAATTALLLLIAEASVCSGVDLEQCGSPLGMESGTIRDEDITASSTFDSGNVGPQNGRVRVERQGGAWCPKQQATRDPKEWLEVDLRRVYLVTATETQGRFGNGDGREYAEAYLLEYWRPRLGKWVRYRDAKGNDVLKGNTNTYLESKQELDPAIWASRVRFLPYSYHRRTVCMRVELYGCRWTDGVVSYSAPQGDKMSAGWELFDSTYDGHWDGRWLRRGLGLLVDGKVAPDHLRPRHHHAHTTASSAGDGWVGWRNDSRGGLPVEIKFEFDAVRDFTAVYLYCGNQVSKDVQVFSQLNVFFSVGGKLYDGEPITYTYMEDLVLENSRNISVKLHHRVGRFVKLRLHFASRWILVSEVTFDSVIARGNFSDETESLDGTNSPVENEDQEYGGGFAGPDVATRSGVPYLAMVMGVLTVAALLLAGAVYLVALRQRSLKALAAAQPAVAAAAAEALSCRGRHSPAATCRCHYAEVVYDYAVPDTEKSTLLVAVPRKPPSLPEARAPSTLRHL